MPSSPAGPRAGFCMEMVSLDQLGASVILQMDSLYSQGIPNTRPRNCLIRSVRKALQGCRLPQVHQAPHPVVQPVHYLHPGPHLSPNEMENCRHFLEGKQENCPKNQVIFKCQRHPVCESRLSKSTGIWQSDKQWFTTLKVT